MNKPLDTLWYTHSPDPTGLGLAVSSGRLADALRPFGTTIQALRESSDREVRESYYDHHLPNSVRHGGNIPAIWAKAQGTNTRLLGVSWVDEVQLLVTSPESGIKSIRDLRDRRFGVPKWANVQIDIWRAQSLRGLENALKLEGMNIADVELVDYPYGGTYTDEPPSYSHGGSIRLRNTRRRGRNNELIGLLRGDIDAIYLKGAHGAHLAHEFGLNVIADIGSHPDPLIRSNLGTPRTLTVDSHLLEHHGDTAVRILETVIRTEQWAWAHPDETRRLIALTLNSSEYWVAAAYGDDVHQRFHTNLDERSLTSLQDLTNFMQRWDFIPQTFNVRDWIDPRPLESLLEKIVVAI